MSKRLEMLEKLTAGGKAEAFTWYALALEYKGQGRGEDAMRTFVTLRGQHPDYVPMYLIAGQLLSEQGQVDEAAAWLQEGIDRARATGQEHAMAEMADLLETIRA